MAREGYGSPPPPEPYLYEQPDMQYSNRSSTRSPSSQTIPSHERFRAPGMAFVPNDSYKADPARYQEARQPIDDAVTSAFRGTDNSSAISPEFISQITSQITANVIQQLRNTNLPPPTNVPPPSNNAASSTSPPPNESPQMEHQTFYTPPSPIRPSDDHNQPPLSPTLFTAQPKSFLPNHGRNTSPDTHKAAAFSQDSQADEADHQDEWREERADRGSRPKGPKRLTTGQDPTILEKIWGTLFDDEGQATARLGQFLRGIATHLIEDYEPLNSLVVTPPKMQKYYEDTKLSSELWPFHIIFDDHTSSISRLYREVEAQHHLTQARLDERPDIPGLTQLGFERWATLLLRAYPDEEFERLQKTALDMPISNPDDRKERFPKEISRRLFPKYPNLKIRDKLEKAISTHCNVTIPTRNPSVSDSQQPNVTMPTRNPSVSDSQQPNATIPTRNPSVFDSQQPNVPPHPRAEPYAPFIPNYAGQSARDGGRLSPVTSRSSQPPPFGTSIERERQSQPAPPSDSAVDDDREDNMPTSQPIERERKPYVAQPGVGKNYDDVNRPPSPPEYIPPPPPPTVRPARSGSIASHGRSNDTSKSRPIPISIHQRPMQPSETLPTPESATVSHHRSNSIYHQQHPYRGTRKRSPSVTTNGGAYEPTLTGDSSYGSHHSSADEENRGYRAYENTRERFSNDRYDASRMKAYDPHERERERAGRERFQSTAGSEGQKAPYANDDQYYRPTSGYPSTTAEGYQAYPASSYR